MQPYQNYFPANYQPFNPYQTYQNYQNYQQPVQQTQQQNQTYTLPTIHAEIVQVDDEQTARNFNVAAGSSQMMIAKDDSAIFVKTAYPNGESKLDVYEKRAVQTSVINPEISDYVTVDMMEKRLEELMLALNKNQYQFTQRNQNQRKENKVKENE
jgi:hypothetical protein